MPGWVWLTGLVVVSALVRLAFAKAHPAPWIFGDELTYASLAESVAKTGHFSIGDQPGLHGLAPGYPLLIAPAYAVFNDLAHAYAAAKGINSIVMSLAAVPVYLIARRFLSTWLSLLAAALSLAVPSFLYTGTIMTENAFYPAFAVCCLLLLLVLERPTLWRQLAAFACLSIAFLIRTQAVALVPAFVTAILLGCLVEARLENRVTRRDLAKRLDAFRVTWIVLGAAVLLVLLAELVRGRSPTDVLGVYGGLTDEGFSIPDVARWFVLHFAELDLYLGILPVAALIALAWEACTRQELPRSLRLFGLLAASIAFWMTLVVAASASRLFAGQLGRIEERNLFHVAPLFLIALVAWISRGLPRRWPAAAVAALVAGALPGAIPYSQFATLSDLSDTMVLVPFWNLVFFGHILAESLPPLVILCSVGAALLFLVWPRRAALVPAVLVLAWFVLLQVSLERQIAATSRGLLTQGIDTRREWIDEAVGGGAQVAVLWTPNSNRMAVLQNGFFNRSLHPVYALDGAPPATDFLPQQKATLVPSSGLVVAPGEGAVRSRYVFADPLLDVAGRVIDRDPVLGTRLYAVNGPVRLRSRLAGVYGDLATSPDATYTRWRCRGGTLDLGLAAMPGLSAVPQKVTVLSGSGSARSVSVPPDGSERSVPVPMSPRRGVCTVRLTTAPTVQSFDGRTIGVRLTAVRYRPS